MKKAYDVASWLRIIGITLSGVALFLTLLRPVDPVFAIGLIYLLLIISALLIIGGQLIVIKFVPEEEYSSKLQRTEAIYDVITTGIVVVVFIIVYAIPFALKYLK